MGNLNVTQSPKPAVVAKAAEPKPKPAADDDDDIDLFGSDDEVDEAAEKLKQERLAAYAAKKSKSELLKTYFLLFFTFFSFVEPATIAKSNVILDVKPWDDETNMAELEKAVRTIEMDGLVWGVSKLVPLAYGIKKLQIVCVVEGNLFSFILLLQITFIVLDEKVSIEELSEKIEAFEDFVQSVDIAAFQKI